MIARLLATHYAAALTPAGPRFGRGRIEVSPASRRRRPTLRSTTITSAELCLDSIASEAF